MAKKKNPTREEQIRENSVINENTVFENIYKWDGSELTKSDLDF